MINKIGDWLWDADGFPLYHYKGGQVSPALDKTGHDAGLPDDPCFILGNQRMTLFAHASGAYQFITGERGWARLNHGRKNRGWNQSILVVTASDGATMTHILTGNPGVRQVFGVGHAGYDYDCDTGVTVTKVISVKPSKELHQGNPSFLLVVTLRNNGSSPVSLRYREELLACYTMMNDQEVTDRRIEYFNHLLLDHEQGIAKAKISCRPTKLLVMPDRPDEHFTHDIAPPSILIHVQSLPGLDTRVETEGDKLCAEALTTLAPGESRSIRFIIGTTFENGEEAISSQIEDMFYHARSHEGAGAYSHLWAEALPDLKDETDEILHR